MKPLSPSLKSLVAAIIILALSLAAAEAGSVFVFADADGTKLYRFDATTGTPLP